MIKKFIDWKNAYLAKSYYERSLWIFGLMVKYVVISTAIFVALMFTPAPAHAATDTQQLAEDSILAASKSAADPDLSGMGMLGNCLAASSTTLSIPHLCLALATQH